MWETSLPFRGPPQQDIFRKLDGFKEALPICKISCLHYRFPTLKGYIVFHGRMKWTYLYCCIYVEYTYSLWTCAGKKGHNLILIPKGCRCGDDIIIRRGGNKRCNHPWEIVEICYVNRFIMPSKDFTELFFCLMFHIYTRAHHSHQNVPLKSVFHSEVLVT